jgi:hypothetical protein
MIELGRQWFFTSIVKFMCVLRSCVVLMRSCLVAVSEPGSRCVFLVSTVKHAPPPPATRQVGAEAGGAAADPAVETAGDS